MQKVVEEIAAAADEIARIADIGGAEVAGLIISVLATDAKLTQEFVRNGPAALLTHKLTWENGCLTWHGADGKIMSPRSQTKPS
jgi:hypothetical protein